jgi:hypothetical protein
MVAAPPGEFAAIVTVATICVSLTAVEYPDTPGPVIVSDGFVPKP